MRFNCLTDELVDSTSKLYKFCNNLNLTEIKKVLISESPIELMQIDRIEIMPTKLCQFNCPWCLGKSIRKNCADKFIDVNVLCKNVFDCIRDNCEFRPFIALSGMYGDPMTHPHFKSLLYAIANTGCKFGIYSNALKLESYIDELVEYSVINDKRNYITFNISALGYHGLLNSVKPYIIKLIEQRNTSALEVNASVTLSKNLTNDMLDEIIKFVKGINFTNSRFNFAMDDIEPSSQDFITKLLDSGYSVHDLNHVKCFSKCYTLLHTVDIDTTGKCYPCSQTCDDYFSDLSFGNINEKTIFEIISSDNRKNLFTQFNPRLRNCRCQYLDKRFNQICNDIYMQRHGCVCAT